MSQRRPSLPVVDLIQGERVHGRVFTDDEIFREELEKIWYRVWVYVGHESEIPQPHDFVVKSIGPRPILMTRDRDGAVHLLVNRCPHRGTELCVAEKGNARTFTCSYHAWTFTNTGELRGFPYPAGYEGADKSTLGLAKVPRVATYRGFVFGSFAAHRGPCGRRRGHREDRVARARAATRSHPRRRRVTALARVRARSARWAPDMNVASSCDVHTAKN